MRRLLWVVTVLFVLVGIMFAITTMQVDPDESRIVPRLLAAGLVGMYGWVPALFTAALAKIIGLLERRGSR